MNARILQLLTYLFVIIFTLSGCKKKSGDTADILNSKIWKKALTDKNPSTNPPGKILYNSVQNCEKDDTFKFESNGNLKVNRNANKCDQNELSEEIQTYTINRASKELVINGTKFTLAEESYDQLKYYAPLSSETGYSYIVNLLE